MLNKKFSSYVAIVLSVFALLGSGYFWGYRIGSENPRRIIAQGVTGIDSRSQNGDFNTFWETWELIDENYLRSDKVSGKDRIYGSIKGLVNSLGDPYSQFFTPEEAKKFEEDVQGVFSGIGAEIGIRKNQLTIISPLKNSPAEKAGIKAGDWILKINSTSTDGMPTEKAVTLIRGPEGTVATLNIYREGWDKPKDFEITRRQIEVPTLETEMKGDYAHISLYSFNANASKLFYEAVRDAINKNAKGIILDLRNNPGGYLEVAVNLAGYFVEPGSVVVSENDRTKTIDTFKSSGNGALKDFPVVVLVNGGSASASEILAGALRDLRGIKLIGETTFGKGTVQQLKELSDGSEFKVTIAHWVLPSGKTLESGGLKPDYEVELTDKDIEAKKDPQLEKAVEIIKQL